MDFKNKISSFDEVCMLDPFKKTKTLEKVQEAVKWYEFYDEVYPEKVIEYHNDLVINKGSI